MQKLIYIYISLFIIVLFSCSAQAQSGDKLGNVKYIGFNTNPILAQVIPLNKVRADAEPFSIMFRNYNLKSKGFSTGVRLGVGVNSMSNGNVNAALYLDIDARGVLYKNLFYSTGLGFGLVINSESAVNSFSSGFVGLRYHWGVEYAFNKFVSLSAESSFLAGIGNDAIGDIFLFKVLPPTTLVAHFNITKNPLIK